ncbi:MAG: signal transduction histidine kinase, partial [Candidatus Promineifilaceae bacterium]
SRSKVKGSIIDIRIADTGVGISNQNLPKIFDPFTGDGDINLHSSSKTKFMGGGPGLGLPIAKGVIEAHGGSLWVESEGYDSIECPGSIFHVELPVLEQ